MISNTLHSFLISNILQLLLEESQQTLKITHIKLHYLLQRLLSVTLIKND